MSTWAATPSDELVFKIKCRQASKHFEQLVIAKDIATCHMTLFDWRGGELGALEEY